LKNLRLIIGVILFILERSTLTLEELLFSLGRGLETSHGGIPAVQATGFDNLFTKL
jgi:hypothetical protein